MLKSNLSVYQNGNKYLVINPVVPSWIVTNLNGVALIKMFTETGSVDKALDYFSDRKIAINREVAMAFIKKAAAASLFIDNPEPKKHTPYLLNGIYLNMTDMCNLRCSYCFAATRNEHGNPLLSLRDYLRIIDEAVSINNNLVVIFTGGEPLLSPNTLKVARYAKKLGLETKILTNATLITEDNVDELIQYFDLFKISIDGSSEELHDYYRGHGAYKKTINAIEMLLERGAHVLLAMTVTRENKADIVPMNQKWGELLTYQPLFPLGRAEKNKTLALTGEEYYEALCSGGNINPFSDIETIIKAHKDKRSIIKCSIGDGELSISCTGDVYPCQLLHNDDFILGNVRSSSLYDIYYSSQNERFKQNTVDTIEGCQDCDFRYLCGGTCQARHFSEMGSIRKSGDFCAYDKKGIVDGLIQACELHRL